MASAMRAAPREPRPLPVDAALREDADDLVRLERRQRGFDRAGIAAAAVHRDRLDVVRATSASSGTRHSSALPR